jgi:transcriptional regulator with XRE-family HTH domain
MEQIQMVDKVLSLQLRGKILGVLIRDARLKIKKSTQELASLIGVSPEEYEQYEFGKQAISLPELELLAKNLQTPIEQFLERSLTTDSEEPKPKIDPTSLIKLRQRIIGAKLRQKRQNSQITLNELAGQIGIDRADLEAFELGSKPVPIPVLEKLSLSLSSSLHDFLEQKTFDEQPKMQTGTTADFLKLPTDIQSFVVKPVNQPYLEIAMKLSEISAERLRAIAEGLLEITY